MLDLRADVVCGGRGGEERCIIYSCIEAVVVLYRRPGRGLLSALKGTRL